MLSSNDSFVHSKDDWHQGNTHLISFYADWFGSLRQPNDIMAYINVFKRI